uniref:Uncharacterized protein n=1 Tax=Trichobilharzia regenti TaxID=157069 RepID=A0AA85IZN3_TRIRE|nr:unnamed protein product [Trichobilharzia regenti]
MHNDSVKFPVIQIKFTPLFKSHTPLKLYPVENEACDSFNSIQCAHSTPMVENVISPKQLQQFGTTLTALQMYIIIKVQNWMHLTTGNTLVLFLKHPPAPLITLNSNFEIYKTTS